MAGGLNTSVVLYQPRGDQVREGAPTVSLPSAHLDSNCFVIITSVNHAPPFGGGVTSPAIRGRTVLLPAPPPAIPMSAHPPRCFTNRGLRFSTLSRLRFHTCQRGVRSDLTQLFHPDRFVSNSSLRQSSPATLPSNDHDFNIHHVPPTGPDSPFEHRIHRPVIVGYSQLDGSFNPPPIPQLRTQVRGRTGASPRLKQNSGRELTTTTSPALHGSRPHLPCLGSQASVPVTSFVPKKRRCGAPLDRRLFATTRLLWIQQPSFSSLDFLLRPPRSLIVIATQFDAGPRRSCVLG